MFIFLEKAFCIYLVVSPLFFVVAIKQLERDVKDVTNHQTETTSSGRTGFLQL